MSLSTVTYGFPLCSVRQHKRFSKSVLIQTMIQIELFYDLLDHWCFMDLNTDIYKVDCSYLQVQFSIRN